MQITFTKSQRVDWIVIVRDDGSRAETRFPHKGPVPHDAVHLFVEAGFALKYGFWGMVGGGVHPEQLLEIAKAAGHASASRAREPDAHIIELLQAERLVEVFEADLWSGSHGDEAGLLELGQTACAYSHVPLPGMAEGTVLAIQLAIAEFAGSWAAVPTGQSAKFAWPLTLQ